MVQLTDSTRRPSVLLADDHRETAEQLRALLQSQFDVVALVGDGHTLVQAAARYAPDVIVTDIAMPGLDGIEATAQICRADPGARVVLITVYADPGLVQRGLAAGAMGYVLKNSAGDDLLPAVQAALCNTRYVSAAIHADDAGHRPEGES